MYNNESVIKNTITSVIEQSYSNWELLLIDDASSDKTIDSVSPFVDSEPKIKLFKHIENKGAAEARNLGTKMAKGNYIAFLDADDLWKKNKLEAQVSVLKNQETDVVFSSYELIDSKGAPLNILVKALEYLTYKKLLKANYVGNLTGMYNCEKLGKIFTKDLKKRQDWLLWLEALKRSNRPAVGLTETLAYYRITKGSLSSKKLNLIKHNFYVYKKGLGFTYFKSIVCLFVFLKEHLIVKRRLIKTIK